jgi:phosphohistidine phosphatase SixA
MDAAEQEYYRCRSEYITARQTFEAIDREWANENKKQVVEPRQPQKQTSQSAEQSLKRLMANMNAEQIAMLKAMAEKQQQDDNQEE